MTTSTLLIGLLALVAVGVAAAALVALRRERRARGRERARLTDAHARAELSDHRADAALEGLPIMALRVDDEGRVVAANGSARERFPFLRPGMGVLQAFSEHELAARVAAALADGTTERLQVRLFAGGRRTYRVTVAPYPIPGGVEGLVFLRDASEAVAYQELRSQFVANVSHELRTPLTGLRGLLEALSDPEMEPDLQRAFLGRAAAETARLEALIADILFLSELEAGQGMPTGAVSDLAEAVRIGVAELAPLAAEQGVTVHAEPGEPARPVPVPLTDRMAATVVRNLVENAVKYAGAGARARVSLSARDGRVELRVADDGVGIAEPHLPHIFERFYRADPSRSKRLGGTGLGLSIVKHIAERSGGTASASSRRGFGTTVRVVLPAASVSVAPDGATGDPALREGG